MEIARDLTTAQFLKRAKAYGWEPEGFMGYFRKQFADGSAINVSVFNAGGRRRAQLAYLIAKGDEREKQLVIEATA